MIDTIFYTVDNLSYNDYVQQVSSGEISEKTIVFANEQKCVYKGGHRYGKMDKAEIQAILGDTLTEITPATPDKVGGMRTGYIQNDNAKYYPVMLDKDNKAFVHVPWSKGDMIPGETGKTGNYVQQAFKTTSGLKPETPNSYFPNGNDGWKLYAENNDGSGVVWMCTRLVDYLGNPVDNWGEVWMISGPKGENGKDGESVEFVYTRTTTADTPSVAIYLNEHFENKAVFNTPKYVPTGWEDHPYGVSEGVQYEWCSTRTKDTNGNWSMFSTPFVWSHWGTSGTDGDGVEYVYFTGTEIPAGQVDTPQSWHLYYPDRFQEREFIPSGSQWKDDPEEFTSQGQKTWVSIRKYDGVNEHWSAYGQPKIWAYYPEDGKVDGYTVDLTNSNMPIGVETNGGISSYTNTCGVQVFHNGVEEHNFTVSTGTVTRSDGRSIAGISVNTTGSTITVTLTNVTNLDGTSIYVPVNVSLPTGSTRNIMLTLFGLNAGEPGAAIDLWTSASVIYLSYDRNTVLSPNIEVGVKISKGEEPVIYRVREAITKGYSFKIIFQDNNSSVYNVNLTQDDFSPVNDYDVATVELYYNGRLIDKEDIPYVSEGKPGESITKVQGLNGIVMRIIQWDGSMPGTHMFNDGSKSENGVYYLDVVELNGSYFRPKKAGVVSDAPITGGEINIGEWEIFAPSGSAAFDYLISESAFIKNLTVHELVITNASGTPEAGVTGNYSGDIRFWAGGSTLTNLWTCPFYVTKDGTLHSEKGEIAGFTFTTDGLFSSTGGSRSNEVSITPTDITLKSNSNNDIVHIGNDIAGVMQTPSISNISIKDERTSNTRKAAISINLSNNRPFLYSQLAIEANSPIVTSQWMLGFGCSMIVPDYSSSIMDLGHWQDSIQNPFVILVSFENNQTSTGSTLSRGGAVALPKLSTVQSLLGVDTDARFAVKMTIICKYNSSYNGYVMGRDGDNLVSDSEYPYLVDNSGTDLGKLEMGKGDVLEVMLMHYTYKTPLGMTKHDYTAYILNHSK